MKIVLVTGANGFIGHHLCPHLRARGHAVRGAVRGEPGEPGQGVDYRPCGNIDAQTDWAPLLDQVDAVVHLAARVHVLRETDLDPLGAFRRVNVAGSETLARQAVAMGARRLVFLSSIGARAAERVPTSGIQPTAYQRSKWEAEQALAQVAAETGLELVILRAPSVYGPGAPGNTARLLTALRRGLPLPLARLNNRRSFLYIGNLVDAIALCLSHPDAPGGVFEVADGQPLSTSEFVRHMASVAGRPARLFPCPPRLLRLAGRMTGRGALIDNLVGDLVVDDRAIRDRLGWQPPYDTVTATRLMMKQEDH